MSTLSFTLWILLLLCLTLTGGCQAPARLVTTRLSSDQVRRIANDTVQAKGYAARPPADWALSVEVRPKGNVWVAHVQSERFGTPYWIQVDDATGRPEFVMPELQVASFPAPPEADWLFKVTSAAARLKFPVSFAAFVQEAKLGNFEPESGGRTPDGRLYFEHTLQTHGASPARFELRLYGKPKPGTFVLDSVTAAEVYYIDALLNRYLLAAPKPFGE